ncbi:hypothetical protein J2X97_002956 [Epilithonimonas hungarica]|uniref:hypothetical protein n=1 Tax=Epilithonimonas hungarica TaxID=454006 RepID=UPI0027843356|nr:hypothetical protein [Epilithonimonas hungarica]MDP9957290.1 hypothetical protein [Epilithonimonas hungarica]
MENMLKISTADIKKIIQFLLSKLENLDENSYFKLDEDLYWNILDEELYDVYKIPSDLTIGSITEDWEFLQAILEDKREMIDYDLYKLATILKILGKERIINKAQNSQ